jgi:hypothetical protein
VARASRPCVSGCELVETRTETHGRDAWRDARATTNQNQKLGALVVRMIMGWG